MMAKIWENLFYKSKEVQRDGFGINTHCIQREKMDQKPSDNNKERRKQLRATRKDFADNAEEQEGLLYGAGLFWYSSKKQIIITIYWLLI